MNALEIVKVIITAILIVAISKISKTYSLAGAILAALPITTFLVLMWMWIEKAETEKIAAHAEGVFWFVLPTLPFFLVFPALVRHGWHFLSALAAGGVMTLILFFALMALLRKTGWYSGM